MTSGSQSRPPGPTGGEDPSGGPSPGSLRTTVDRVRAALSRVDGMLRTRPALAVPFAVLRKYGDDGGGRWAALVAYFGFFSLFPLLLVFTTILGFVVQGNQHLQDRVLDSALAQFPIIGDQIRQELGALHGSIPALAIGLAGSIWAGMAIGLTLQDAMNDVWDVPRAARPSFLAGRLRALLTMAGLGIAALATAGLTALAATPGSFGWPRALGIVGTLSLNVLVFGAAFRYLTVAEVRWRRVLPGAVTAAVAWMALLAIGSWLVDRQLRQASTLYGFFGIVLGLMSWIYLGAQVTMLSAELNVVLARRLWPRSLQPPPLTDPDRRVLAAQAEEQAERRTEEVHVHFRDEAGPDAEGGPPTTGEAGPAPGPTERR